MVTLNALRSRHAAWTRKPRDTLEALNALRSDRSLNPLDSRGTRHTLHALRPSWSLQPRRSCRSRIARKSSRTRVRCVSANACRSNRSRCTRRTRHIRRSTRRANRESRKVRRRPRTNRCDCRPIHAEVHPVACGHLQVEEERDRKRRRGDREGRAPDKGIVLENLQQSWYTRGQSIRNHQDLQCIRALFSHTEAPCRREKGHQRRLCVDRPCCP